jgi:hypothetical protein
MSRLRLIAIGALALVLALPGSALAAPVDVTGTVTGADGATPAPGVEIAIRVQGSDEIHAATSDATGAWTIPLDLVAGDVLELSATGETSRTEPDDEGCVSVATPTARMEVTVGETALEPIPVVLDGEITSEVCTATATPEPVVTPKTVVTPRFEPQVTPPSTDVGGGAGSTSGSGTLVVVGLLALVSALVLLGTSRRPAPRPVRRD